MIRSDSPDPERIRDGVTLVDAPEGTLVLDPARSARHRVPDEIVFLLRMAFLSGRAPADSDAHAWLEARHLVASARVQRVETWAAGSGALSAPAPPAAGGRFSCHGCGACCKGYVVWPISPAERATILEHAAVLAPHVPAPTGQWFETADPSPDGSPAFSLGRRPDGRCLFLDDDGLCSVHRRLGVERKPLTCRRFPLWVARRPDGVALTLKVQCETLWRSHDDGVPVEDQGAWRADAAAGPPYLVVPALVRVAGEVYVPYALARSVEAEVVERLRHAASAREGLEAAAIYLHAVRRTLPRPPDPADLDRARAAADRTGAAPNAGAGRRTALGTIADALARAHAARRERRSAGAPDWIQVHDNDRLAEGWLGSLQTALAAGSPDDPLPGSRPPADAVTADFVRGCFLQLAAGGRPLAEESGLLRGFGRLSALYEISAWAAGALAAAAGRPDPGRADWNRALSILDRVVRVEDLADATPALDALAGTVG